MLSPEEILNIVIATIDECYERVDNLKDVDQLMGTDDIFEAVQCILPSDSYGPKEIAGILLDQGFSFTTISGPAMQFAWLIRRR